MKTSLKLLFCILTLGVMSAPALRAQDDKAPPADNGGGGKKGGKGGRGMMTPEQQVAALDKAVGPLTDDQKTKITTIYDKAQKDVQAVPQEERRQKMGEIMQTARTDVRALLTADQQKKFDDMPAPGRGGKKKGGNN